ncbi:MAG: hypothetical protein HUJ25_06005 [Crocinitomicaceae bacterium]|nr:hypothetical protein [Crocinitomicaceae bacterium]
MKYLLVYLILTSSVILNGQELYKQNKTHTYDEAQSAYEKLQKTHPKHCKLIQFGQSDYGKNISLFIINKDGNFQPSGFEGKSRLLINNAIHPGEPCGVDASLKLAGDLLNNTEQLPDNVVIGIIPMYNVGGGHNRNCCSRANQNGPEEYGFRGNAKNLDLNRDFIKSDSKNTRTFYSIYHFLKPNIFVDTHTSNGADYQYIMTLITSQTDKMHPYLRAYTLEKLNPYLFQAMKNSNYDMVPYVHSIKSTPNDGIKDYLETPRYSTGYTNLFNTIGFVTETHMLKTFEERVESTYTFLDLLIGYMDENYKDIVELKRKADEHTKIMDYFPINWQLDTATYNMIDFNGYEAEYVKSEVTGVDRLLYNHDKPWKGEIRYFNHYRVSDSVKRPEYYIVPQAWKEVIALLQLNYVEIYKLTDDVVIDVEAYYIDDYQTGTNPYEGHYLHRDMKVSKEVKQTTFYKGDFVIPTRNANAQFIVQTLEPHAPDSYFAWNFFDAILQQKEWFSPYVFEDTAIEILKENEELRKEFMEKKESDEEFANSSWAQLYFIYKRSDNYERTHNLYPVCRYMDTFESDQLKEASTLIGW